MKKTVYSFAFLVFSIFIISCSSKKESASSIAQKWCDLNGKVYKAEGEAKDKAKKELNEYENKMEAKYKNDEAFMKEIERETEKCEAASEGR
jgi:hypothetical protein